MDVVIFILELAVFLGAIYMGTQTRGVGLGLWGGVVRERHLGALKPQIRT